MSFCSILPFGRHPRGKPRKIRFYSLRSYAYFVELTSSVLLGYCCYRGSQIAKCRFASFCPSGVILTDAAQNTLLFTLFIRVFCRTDFVVLFGDCGWRGSQIAKCRFAPFCPSGVILTDAAQNTLLFTSFIRVFCRTDFVSSHCLLSINKGPRKGVLCLSG